MSMDSVNVLKNNVGEDIPEYARFCFQARQHPYCVCVFVLNEGERILSQLRKMRFLNSQIDIIVADGGSTDGAIEAKKIQLLGVNTLLVKHGPGGLSTQMRMAFDFALESGYEGLVVIDGNDKDDTSAIPAFCQALNQGYDHVQGSRFIAGGRHANTPLSRLLGIRLVHAPLTSLAARFHYTDSTNGFRAYSRRLLMDKRIAPFRSVFVAYEMHTYLQIRAARLGFNVRELPVTRCYPPNGKTITKITPISGNLRMLQTLVFASLGIYNPAP